MPSNEVQIFFVLDFNGRSNTNYISVYTPFGCIATKNNNNCSQGLLLNPEKY